MLIVLVSSLLLQAPAPKALDREVAKNIGLLRSTDRMERYGAAVTLAKQRSLPEDSIDPIIDYVKAQVEDAMIPPAMDRPRRDARVEKVPIVGDEVSVAAIKANPDRHIGKQFVLVGGICY